MLPWLIAIYHHLLAGSILNYSIFAHVVNLLWKTKKRWSMPNAESHSNGCRL